MIKIVKLFSLLPICTIKGNDKRSICYLFGIIPFFKIKSKKFNSYDNEWTQRCYKCCAEVGEKLRCDGKTLLTSNTYIGSHCYFNGGEIHGAGKVVMGSYIHCGVELLIIAQNHNYDKGEEIPYSPNDFIYKDIEIGDFVWIGSRVTILPGTKIGEGAIIQAGSVVHGTIPPLAIVGGNPAKVFKYRDAEHFNKLKEEKRFY